MNKILRTLAFALGLICITNNAFGIAAIIREEEEEEAKRLTKEERLEKLRNCMREYKGYFCFYSAGLEFFLESHEEEFNQTQDLLLVLESVKLQLQYVYSHLQLDNFSPPTNFARMTEVLCEFYSHIGLEEERVGYALLNALEYIDRYKLFIPEVREQIKKLIFDVMENPKQLEENCQDLSSKHFHTE